MLSLLSQIHYSPTITLGAAVITAILGLAFLYRLFIGVALRSTNDVLTKRIEALEGDVADKDRRLVDKARQLEECKGRLTELGAEKDAALAKASARQATVETLNQQIQRMPKYEDVIAFGTEQLKAVNTAAAERQERFVAVVIDELKAHDEHVEKIHQQSEQRAGERHEAQIRTLDAIVERLNGGTK